MRAYVCVCVCVVSVSVRVCVCVCVYVCVNNKKIGACVYVSGWGMRGGSFVCEEVLCMCE